MLRHLTWQAAVLAVMLILVIRPLAGWVALWKRNRGEDRVGDDTLDKDERLVTAFFGVRGVGSLFYLAYATGQVEFGNHELLWATVGFTVMLSVIVHGVAATPAMKWLDHARPT
jgi:NhaP-type Na+/H+ or K+/H+ antiporter